MCSISRKTRRKTVTGYKILAEKNGKFYSSFTGQLFKVGKVKLPPRGIVKRLWNGWNSNLDRIVLHKLPFYNKKFVGKTGVYKKLSSLNNFANFHRIQLTIGCNLILAKVTLGGNIYLGRHDDSNIFASDTVLEIKKIQTLIKL